MQVSWSLLLQAFQIFNQFIVPQHSIARLELGRRPSTDHRIAFRKIPPAEPPRIQCRQVELGAHYRNRTGCLLNRAQAGGNFLALDAADWPAMERTPIGRVGEIALFLDESARRLLCAGFVSR